MIATAELFIAAVLLGGCGAAWWRLLRRRMPGEPLIGFEPRRPVPWDVPVVVPVVLLYLGVRLAAMTLAERSLHINPLVAAQLGITDDPQRLWAIPAFAITMFQAAAASQLITALAVAVLLLGIYRANRDDLGFSTDFFRSDVRLGIAGFFALAVPAVALQAVLQTFIAKSQHPIVLALESGGDVGMILWALLAAVVIAPVVEEFLFRGVLQGLLERLETVRREVPSPSDTEPGETELAPVMIADKPSAAPIFASAMVFALMHLGNGVDVGPLFFLALGLGYLYRQTHRLWPGIVVHTLLNAFSLAMLMLQAK